MYVEEIDGEMDVYFEITKNNNNKRPRYLRMIATVFKKSCDIDDRKYKPCSHTSYCIRKELFCDGQVNCAWPDGNLERSDEVNCKSEGID